MGSASRSIRSFRVAAAVVVNLVLASLALPSALAQPPAPAPNLPGPPPNLPGPPPNLPGPPQAAPAPPPVVPAAPEAPPAVAAPLDAAAPPPGCPDIQVLFARGTTEPPGLGAMGEAFVDDLKARVGPRSVAVYPVQYPASPDFPTAVQGVVDASTQVQKTAAACPDTHMVLAGYSQGAAVMGFVTTELVPDGVSATDVPQPMPPDIANHVVAVALLGTPSDRFMNVIQQPEVKIGPLYQPKTIELCVPNDFVCSPGNDIGAHARYISDGLVGQAADFAASKIAASPKPTSQPG